MVDNFIIKKMRFPKDCWRIIQQAAKDALVTHREFLVDDEMIENINIGNLVEDGNKYEFTQVFKIKPGGDRKVIIDNAKAIMDYYKGKCDNVETKVLMTNTETNAKSALVILKEKLGPEYKEAEV
ncbi:MAG: hypothetical protein ACFFE4_06225 [Candidatus Thorarchaeota archaeon]